MYIREESFIIFWKAWSSFVELGSSIRNQRHSRTFTVRKNSSVVRRNAQRHTTSPTATTTQKQLRRIAQKNTFQVQCYERWQCNFTSFIPPRVELLCYEFAGYVRITSASLNRLLYLPSQHEATKLISVGSQHAKQIIQKFNRICLHLFHGTYLLRDPLMLLNGGASEIWAEIIKKVLQSLSFMDKLPTAYMYIVRVGA